MPRATAVCVPSRVQPDPFLWAVRASSAGIVAAAAVRGDGQYEFAASGGAQQFVLQVGAAVLLYGYCGCAVFQQRYAGQYLRRFAEHQAERDRVQAGSFVGGVQGQAQQICLGEPGPQWPVEVVGDGAGGQCGARYPVREDPAEDGVCRLACCLLFLGESEVHGPARPHAHRLFRRGAKIEQVLQEGNVCGPVTAERCVAADVSGRSQPPLVR